MLITNNCILYRGLFVTTRNVQLKSVLLPTEKKHERLQFAQHTQELVRFPSKTN